MATDEYCDGCQGILRMAVPEPPPSKSAPPISMYEELMKRDWFSKTLHELTVSAPTCCLCAIILDSLQPTARASDEQKSVLRMRSQSYDVFPERITTSSGASMVCMKVGQSGVLLRADNVGKTIELRFYLSEHLADLVKGPEETWQSPQLSWGNRATGLQTWLKSCVTLHEKCSRPSMSHNTYPKRLLDLRYLTESSKVYLRDTSVFHLEFPEYATLSYCWGNQTFIKAKTMLQNLDAHLNDGLLYQNLPRTYQDSMSVLRSIGINFLWIDALCIIQNSPADWETESANMAGIYHGSQLTIAAMGAKDSMEGLPLTISNPKISSLSWTCENDTGANNVYVRQEGLDKSDRSVRALDTRGWVLQETTLSRRVVCFYEREMVWHCSHEVLHEIKFPESIWYSSLISNQLPTDWSTSEAHKSWRQIGQGYGRKAFTFTNDIQSGFAGLISHFALNTNDEHILGHWRSTLHTDLAFQIIMNGRDPKAQSDHAFPSWTWLSLLPFVDPQGYPVRWHLEDNALSIQNKVTLVEFAATWSGTPTTSILLSSRLLLKNVVRHGIAEHLSQGMHGIGGYYRIDGTILHWMCDVNTLEYDGAVCLLVLYTKEVEPRYGMDLDMDDIFLVLRPVSGQYQRLGVGNVEWSTQRSEEAFFHPRAEETLSLI